MSEPWYETVPATGDLSQGDIIRSARVLLWKSAAESSSLRDWVEERSIDVIVMTQACDLEHRKVANVVLCELIPLSALPSRLG